MAATYDILVVGGGHAGCEAALAAAGMGARVCLATLSADTVGALSCNPAMGGVGKGQIVREIDALGGAMGRVTDATAIQYRMLNTSKGEAVRALRAQVDKQLYCEAMQRRVAALEALDVVAGCVDDLRLEAGRVVG
ncbi:MAG: FAD-dependent oxidoreductase, partial [Planctomycetota bacterium]